MDLNVLIKWLYFLAWLQFVSPKATPTPGCLDPGPIANGNRDPPPTDGYLKKGTVIQFECDENYTLHGLKKMMCGRGNRWYSSNDLPECVRKFCIDPDIPNSMVTGTTVSGSPDHYVVDSHAMLTCNHGYTISLVTGVSDNHCGSDGNWVDSWATCEVIQAKCGLPPTIAHSSYKPSSLTYFPEDQVVYTCEEGFHMVGTERITCGHLGNWTDTGQTTCTPEYHCPDPGKPENGNRCCQDAFIPGVTIRFYCDSYYNLVGKDKITCQPEGYWDGDAPSCVLASTDMPQNGQNMLTSETFTIVVAISGSIMGILTVTVILSIRECCTQRRRRPRSHCRYHSSIAARVARMRERSHSHLMSLTSNMEVPLPSYEEAIAGNPQPPAADASAHETGTAGNNDIPPELPPRPPHLAQVPLQTTQSQPRPNSSPTTVLNPPSPPVPRSSRIPPWRRRRSARSQQQQSGNSGLLEHSAELSELPHSTNSQQTEESSQPLIDILDESSRNDVEEVSSESGVISDQQQEEEQDGSDISAIAGELTPSASSESLSTYEGIAPSQPSCLE